MKKLVAALLLLNSLAFLHADILANGDFSDGKAHWKGDAKSSSDKEAYDMSTVDNPTAPNGIIVNLKGTWTKVFQTFNTHEDSFNYSITFKTSADYAPVARMNPMGMGTPPGIPGTSGPRNEFLSTILGGDYSGKLNPPSGNTFLLLIVDMTAATFSSAIINPTPGSADQQTITGVMEHVPAHDEKTIYLVFSPGKGSVTLLNVSLTPVESSSESVPFPGR